MHVVVQFYPWFKFDFLLLWGIIMYDTEFETKENKLSTKDKIEPQHTYYTKFFEVIIGKGIVKERYKSILSRETNDKTLYNNSIRFELWVILFSIFWFRFVPGGPPVGTRPLPSKPLPSPTKDIAAIKVSKFKSVPIVLVLPFSRIII